MQDMNVEVHESTEGGYYVILIDDDNQSFIYDIAHASHLNMSYASYQEQLAKYGAAKEGDSEDLYFETQKACQRFIDEYFEPMLIMAKLRGKHGD